MRGGKQDSLMNLEREEKTAFLLVFFLQIFDDVGVEE